MLDITRDASQPRLTLQLILADWFATKLQLRALNVHRSNRCSRGAQEVDHGGKIIVASRESIRSQIICRLTLTASCLPTPLRYTGASQSARIAL
jgi:hypothetical protein